MNTKNEYLIETDVLIHHLTFNDKGRETYLETLMQKGLCFTTMLNASELYYTCSNEEEKNIMDDLLSSLKVLGLHSRYSLRVFNYADKVETLREAIICTVAEINKLPIVSLNKSNYIKSGLKTFHPEQL